MSVTLLPAVAQLALLEQRKISALELADEHIRQIEHLNPVLNAIIDFDAERVRTEARQAGFGVLAGLPSPSNHPSPSKGIAARLAVF